MAACLLPAEIEGLLASTLSPQDKARVDAHLARCEQCREALEARREENQLFGKLKRA